MTAKRIEVSVDGSKCLGYGICLGLPQVFDMPGGSGVAVTNQQYFEESLLADIEDAARNCPAAAIRFAVVEVEEH